MDTIWILAIVCALMGFKAFTSKLKKELVEPEQPDLSDVEMPELHFPKEEVETPTAPQNPVSSWDTVRTQTPTSIRNKSKKQQKKTDTLPDEGVRNVTDATVPTFASSVDEPCKFSSPTPDELRRAVIWSEILQRKYC